MKPNPSHAAKRRPTPVTLIVGLKCKDAIVLASDSQITLGTAKRTDSIKMETLYFAGLPVLVAQAGNVALSGRCVDILRATSFSAPPNSPDQIGLAAQKAIRDLRDEVRAFRFGIPAEELDEYFRREGIDCEIMLGFFLGREAHLCTVGITMPVYQKSRFYYEAVGCGAPLGHYLLAEHSTPEMSVEFASMIAIHTVEIVKRHDAFCGGRTRIGIIRREDIKTGRTSVFNDAQVDKMVSILTEADAAAKADRHTILHERIAKEGITVRTFLDLQLEEEP